MFDPGPLRPPWLVLEALGTGAILTEIATILASHSQTVRKDRAALLADKCLGRGIQYFLAQLASGVDPVPGLERVTLVRVEPDKMVHIMHLLFSVRVDFYLTRRCLFACLGDLPAEPSPPPVVEIPHKAFAARRSIHSVLQVEHVTHLGGISPPDWQTKPCERAVKTAGTE